MFMVSNIDSVHENLTKMFKKKKNPKFDNKLDRLKLCYIQIHFKFFNIILKSSCHILQIHICFSPSIL